MTQQLNKRFARGKWYRYAPRIKAAMAPVVRNKKKVAMVAAVAFSSLITQAYYLETRPATFGMKAVESTAMHYGDSYKIPMKAAKPIANRIQMRRSEQEQRKASHLPKPTLTRVQASLLKESGIEYWKANPKARNNKPFVPKNVPF